ncbi:RNA helicase [Malassezia vespertilionis]|uniref:RNA helicase n=1 Tax=Malassezia vespertilionis TaxID=2020962 RepID=A0A2N1JA44_9BASI|nr:RNA helicase [Malassezia vespertilionis]PKI83403.1 Dbp10p [Malassezia vespertilionis]WFD07203.1 RNA helicase [Malassezia vespertilionis]
MAKEIDFLAEDEGAPPILASRKRADDSDDDAAFIAVASQRHNVKAGAEVAKNAQKGKGKTASGIVSGGGSFQSMGLHPSLLRSLLLRGFTTPTPIQRRAIPAIMAQPSQDVVGMSRTGSGKTLSYIVPMIHRLNGRHSSTFGVKAIILCPSRELALQIFKVGKDLARGWRSDDDQRGEAIRWALIVGGENLDQQFATMATNPDVVIGTPGRLLHLIVEMNMDLRAVEYVVFDEADRLFEMGFAEQLEELLRRLPPARQTLLFSATLPKSLVEFARAGLDANPKLIRLDADSKISPELRMAFFSVKPNDKDAALLLLLQHVIHVPTGVPADEEESAFADEGDTGSKRRRASLQEKPRKRNATGTVDLKPYQTVIFCATKHHVEYLLLVLTTMGFACSHIYSSLDQTERTIQMNRFRQGRASLLIVTDLAARGIDLPVLEHVINYDFPPQPRIFVHRVGRTARAGRTGWVWNLCTHSELPYLIDLQLFLTRPLTSSHTLSKGPEALDLQNTLVMGTLPRDQLDELSESVHTAMHAVSATAVAYDALVGVVKRAHSMYTRSQPKASQESYRRAKDMVKDAERSAITGTVSDGWALAGSQLEDAGVHDVLCRPAIYNLQQGETRMAAHDDPLAAARASLLAKVHAFRPGETVFEIGARGQHAPLAQLMQERRRTLLSKQQRARTIEEAKRGTQPGAEEDVPNTHDDTLSEAEEEDIEAVFDTGRDAAPDRSFRDPNFYMGYKKQGADEERGYALNTGSFVEQAGRVAFSLGGDDVGPGHSDQRPNQSRWDTKKKKFVKGDGAGADNQKMIRSETGLKLPASYRSGRFDEWRKEQRIDMPRVGEDESNLPASVKRISARVHDGNGMSHRRGFKHTQLKAPKPLDKKQYGYHKQLKQRQDRAGQPSNVHSELKSASQIQRERRTKEKRREKNARPTRRKKK